MNIKIPAGMADAILASNPKEGWSQGLIQIDKARTYYGSNRPDSVLEIPFSLEAFISCAQFRGLK